MAQISVGVSRSLTGQTCFCPACLTQPVSLKRSSAFCFIHLPVVDPRPLVTKLAVLVMSGSTTSKALVCAPAFRESTGQLIPLVKVLSAFCCSSVCRGLARGRTAKGLQKLTS